MREEGEGEVDKRRSKGKETWIRGGRWGKSKRRGGGERWRKGRRGGYEEG